MKQFDECIVRFLANHMKIDFNVFGSFMKDLVGNNKNG